MSDLLFQVLRTGLGKDSHDYLYTPILRLHSRVSFAVYMFSSGLLTLKHIIGGDDISCLEDRSVKDKDDNLNAFCWVHSTYSTSSYMEQCNKADCIYPGIGQMKPGSHEIYHTYYQWSSLVLFAQALICYIPKFIWNWMENGQQKMLAYDRKLLYYPISGEDPAAQSDHLKRTVSFFRSHHGHQLWYYWKYLSCEILGIVLVILNVIITNHVLHGEFWSYGKLVFEFYTSGKTHKRISPMTKLFPLMGKCKFSRIGPGGNPIYLDPICVLPLNALNQYIYLGLWFYMAAAFGISCIAFLYRFFFIFRCFRIKLLATLHPKVKPEVRREICNELKIGEWFLMHMMSGNVSQDFYHEFLNDLSKKFQSDQKIEIIFD